jgi:hypothetical protein
MTKERKPHRASDKSLGPRFRMAPEFFSFHRTVFSRVFLSMHGDNHLSVTALAGLPGAPSRAAHLVYAFLGHHRPQLVN